MIVWVVVEIGYEGINAVHSVYERQADARRASKDLPSHEVIGAFEIVPEQLRGTQLLGRQLVNYEDNPQLEDES